MLISLADIFHDLTSGEFAQLSIGGRGKGSIAEEDYHLIIPHINLALLDLYTKFPLRERELQIDLYDWISLYKLHSDYAKSSPVVPEDGYPKYISDTDTFPFTDDIIRIEEVFNEDGSHIALNQSEQHGGVFTPSYDTLQVPRGIGGGTIFVVYRARPDLIPTDVKDPTTVPIEVPMSHRSALLYYVASRVFASVTGQDTSAVGNEYRMKYMEEVNQIKTMNLNLEYSTSLNLRIHNRGWV